MTFTRQSYAAGNKLAVTINAPNAKTKLNGNNRVRRVALVTWPVK